MIKVIDARVNNDNGELCIDLARLKFPESYKNCPNCLVDLERVKKVGVKERGWLLNFWSGFLSQLMCV